MRDLQKAGLVQVEKKNASGNKKVVQTSSQIPSSSIKNYHKQMLSKAMDSLDSVALTHREFQSIGVALLSEDFAKLKIEIDEFTDRLMAKYHKNQAASVYQVQICVFPLTKEKSSD